MQTIDAPKAVAPANSRTGARAQCIFSVDVEDWFHILDVASTPPMEKWASLPSHVEKDFRRLLDLFDERQTKVTCFFLAWVAERFPHLVRDAASRGHEIASHGYAHRLVYQCTADEFEEDVARAKNILEDIIGRPVLGYRSPGFSCTEDVPWFFDRLIEAGYVYDSSVFPAKRSHGGMATDRLDPHRVKGRDGDIIEFPITVAPILGKRMCLFGGGYLRLFPYSMIRRASRNVLDEQRPVVFYIHPREINPDHPRLPMSLSRRFKSYVNLRTTEPKIRSLLADFEMITFAQYLQTAQPASLQ